MLLRNLFFRDFDPLSFLPLFPRSLLRNLFPLFSSLLFIYTLGVYMEDLPSIRTRQVKAMTAAVRSAITRGKDLTLPNRNGVTPVS